jgi:hypothetical protein
VCTHPKIVVPSVAPLRPRLVLALPVLALLLFLLLVVVAVVVAAASLLFLLLARLLHNEADLRELPRCNGAQDLRRP